MFTLHGMRPGDVVPTGAVFLRHVHPDDRTLVERVMIAAEQGPAGCEYRLIDLTGHERTVTLAVARGSDGATTGLAVDVTTSRNRAVADQVNGQLALALESRTVIDQAKGVVMSTFAVDHETAFRALAMISQHRNIRLRVIADAICGSIVAAGALEPVLRAELQRCIALGSLAREQVGVVDHDAARSSV